MWLECRMPERAPVVTIGATHMYSLPALSIGLRRGRGHRVVAAAFPPPLPSPPPCPCRSWGPARRWHSSSRSDFAAFSVARSWVASSKRAPGSAFPQLFEAQWGQTARVLLDTDGRSAEATLAQSLAEIRARRARRVESDGALEPGVEQRGAELRRRHQPAPDRLPRARSGSLPPTPKTSGSPRDTGRWRDSRRAGRQSPPRQKPPGPRRAASGTPRRERRSPAEAIPERSAGAGRLQAGVHGHRHLESLAQSSAGAPIRRGRIRAPTVAHLPIR